MPPLILKFIVTASAISIAMLAGYLCRRFGRLKEEIGETLMTLVAVLGYPAAGLLTIWGTPLKAADAMLPVGCVLHVIVLTLASLALARLVTRDRAEIGLLAITGGIGNNGFTMGAFILYLLYGEQAMGLSNIYLILFMPVAVLLMYPIARHHATAGATGSWADLLRSSLFDWRAIGLPVSLAAIALSVAGVPRPAFFTEWHLVDIVVYTITPVAFFAIGLRFHGSKILPLWRQIAWLGVIRFPIGAAAGIAIAWLIGLTPWAFEGLRWKVFVFQAFVPTAVTSVAIANMFGLKPREASVLFVSNTLLYLAIVLPLALLGFAR
ncbi:MAG: hypothetical protein IT577_23205 [Verrucomicrobiae bacterium]|nr:hypothetical protein [Verrucomicrobiae bacterium]